MAGKKRARELCVECNTDNFPNLKKIKVEVNKANIVSSDVSRLVIDLQSDINKEIETEGPQTITSDSDDCTLPDYDEMMEDEERTYRDNDEVDADRYQKSTKQTEKTLTSDSVDCTLPDYDEMMGNQERTYRDNDEVDADRYQKSTKQTKKTLTSDSVDCTLPDYNEMMEDEEDNYTEDEDGDEKEVDSGGPFEDDIEDSPSGEWPKEPKIVSTVRPRRLIGPSSVLAWAQVLASVDPASANLHSPVHAVEFNLLPRRQSGLLEDAYVVGFVWVLSMSEQSLYHNSLTLMADQMRCGGAINNSLGLALRANYSHMTLQDVHLYWRNITLLGEGAFGAVYKVLDARLGHSIAVKHIKRVPNENRKKGGHKPDSVQSRLIAHFTAILDYLRERNYLLEARSSPYVVQFLYSLTFTDLGGLFLVCEWCLGDLKVFCKSLAKLSQIRLSDVLQNTTHHNYQTQYDIISATYDFDLQRVILTYAFETFCGLDFLAKCNIIHRDLKPANIMISQTFHIKIGDFGLVNNTRFVTNKVQAYMMEPEEANLRLPKLANKASCCGTHLYYDLEMMWFLYIEDEFEDWAADKIMGSKDRRYRDIRDLMPMTLDTAKADFMTDLWAAGLIVMEMLFLGSRFHVQKMEYLTDEVWEKDLVRLMLRRSLHNTYIKDGFPRALGPRFQTLSSFLASLFNPRRFRGGKFGVWRNIGDQSIRVLHMPGLETLPEFVRYGLRTFSSHLTPLPPQIRTFLLLGQNQEQLLQSSTSSTTTAREWLQNLQQDSQFFSLKPGYDVVLNNQ